MGLSRGIQGQQLVGTVIPFIPLFFSFRHHVYRIKWVKGWTHATWVSPSERKPLSLTTPISAPNLHSQLRWEELGHKERKQGCAKRKLLKEGSRPCLIFSLGGAVGPQKKSRKTKMLFSWMHLRTFTSMREENYKEGSKFLNRGFTEVWTVKMVLTSKSKGRQVSTGEIWCLQRPQPVISCKLRVNKNNAAKRSSAGCFSEVPPFLFFFYFPFFLTLQVFCLAALSLF